MNASHAFIRRSLEGVYGGKMRDYQRQALNAVEAEQAVFNWRKGAGKAVSESWEEKSSEEIVKDLDEWMQMLRDADYPNAQPWNVGGTTALEHYFRPYPWWKRVRGWLVWHCWQRWTMR